jgi:hypothetical protein
MAARKATTRRSPRRKTKKLWYRRPHPALLAMIGEIGPDATGEDQAALAERLREREDSIAAMLEASPALRRELGVPASEDVSHFIRRTAGAEWVPAWADVLLRGAEPAALVTALRRWRIDRAPLDAEAAYGRRLRAGGVAGALARKIHEK